MLRVAAWSSGRSTLATNPTLSAATAVHGGLGTSVATARVATVACSQRWRESTTQLAVAAAATATLPSKTSLNLMNSVLWTPTSALSTSAGGDSADAKSPNKSKTLEELSETWMTGTNANYLDYLYEQWQRGGSSAVEGSWPEFFARVEAQARVELSDSLGGTAAASAMTDSELSDSLRLMLLVRAYQFRGHQIAAINPLGTPFAPRPRELDLDTYDFTEADLDRHMSISPKTCTTGLIAREGGMTLREFIAELEKAYTGPLAVEYMHMSSMNEKDWLRDRFEASAPPAEDAEDRIQTFRRLAAADKFERFLMKKFTTAKRFGLDGCESLIPGLETAVDHAADRGVNRIIFGMPHRGRLNVLANVVRKPLEMILKEFESGGAVKPIEGYAGSGDVKYHLGTSCLREVGKNTVHLSLLANPSHLEAVNSVVMGKARAQQNQEPENPSAILPVILHGDAAFCGQGVVYEGFHLSQLPAYTTQGTIHVVVNNQIGFTTDPVDGRTDVHPTAPAHVVDAPVFHVNGDDPDAINRAMRLAVEYRTEFKKDVVIDLVCYRRYGHNEVDQPEFTQPLLYKTIGKQAPAVDLYRDRLLADGVLTQDEVNGILSSIDEELEAAWTKSSDYKSSRSDWVDSSWRTLVVGTDKYSPPVETSITADEFATIGKALYSLPEGFTPHRTLGKILEKRQEMFSTGSGIDWGTAEGLAFGSLMLDGKYVRMTGQDCERGTFSHRHAVVHDQKTGAKHTMLGSLPTGDNITIVNSPLDEYAVLGFELGYSMNSPDNLVLWEAQFGDFANGAQIIFDQFLSSGEAKWLRQNGLTVLLPHGFDGMGPEHSSARLERFLQMSDQDPSELCDPDFLVQKHNWQVCNITTPANYFHALRRQIYRGFRKPLVVMAPKGLLRSPAAASTIDDFTATEFFQPYIGDSEAGDGNPANVRRVIFCSGQVYYDLARRRSEIGATDVALCRIEQLSPLPTHILVDELTKYKDADVVWAQEEHRNMGAWNHMFLFLTTALEASGHPATFPTYVGRGPAAAPGTGFVNLHNQEKEAFLTAAFEQ